MKDKRFSNCHSEQHVFGHPLGRHRRPMRRGHGMPEMAKGPDGHRRGGHGGGRRRILNSDDLRILILHFVQEGPRHGYDLIRATEELTRGQYAPSPGVVYPTLTLLTEMGDLQEVGEEGSRRAFGLTEQGLAKLQAQREAADAVIAKLQALAEQEPKMDVGPVERALQNLNAVLRAKLHKADLTKEEILDIAASIAEVSAKIERI